jgi:hypothetical protein
MVAAEDAGAGVGACAASCGVMINAVADNAAVMMMSLWIFMVCIMSLVIAGGVVNEPL